MGAEGTQNGFRSQEEESGGGRKGEEEKGQTVGNLTLSSAPSDVGNPGAGAGNRSPLPGTFLPQAHLRIRGQKGHTSHCHLHLRA